MRWRSLLIYTVGIGVLFGSGCTAKQSLLRMDPEILATIHGMGESSTQVRGQKPDENRNNTKPNNLLDVPPPRSAELANTPPSGRICATVNGKAILEEEVRASAYQPLAAVQRLPEPQRTQKTREIWKAALDGLIEREIVLQDAYERINSRGGVYLEQIRKSAAEDFEKNVVQAIKKSAKIKTEEEFEAVLKQQGVSLGMMKSQWEKQYISREYLQSRVFTHAQRVGHRQIREYYDRHPEKFKVNDSVTWQDIFISTAEHNDQSSARQFAEILAQRLRSGADFGKLSKQYDNGVASLREDSLGVGNQRGEINPPQAEAVLFQLREGEVGPLVEVATGFHIVRVLKRQRAGRRPFDEKTQKEIRNRLRNEVADREMKKIVERLKRNAIIELANYTP